MNIAIVDDEAPARARLRELLRDIPDCNVVGEAGNGREALELWQNTQPDVMLLDIRMPVMDGMETARHLAAMDNPPAVIFTTAFDEFAVAAFDTHAIAYLLKPVRREKLADALSGAGRLNRVQLTRLATRHDAEARRHLCARLGDKLHVVAVENVQCFIAEQKYVTVCHTSGELLIDEALKDLEQEFAGRFIRVHRNALVAVAQVERLEKDDAG
ncbi:MAG: LytR/AlgR family response regulator transcription factor, partial [Gammaproteobacteria bacterium]